VIKEKIKNENEELYEEIFGDFDKTSDSCDAFPNKLDLCESFSCKFEHPFTGEIMERKIVGLVDDKCQYTEEMPNNGRMDCEYSESLRKAVAQYYRDLAIAESVGTSVNADLGSGDVKTTYTIDGKEVENPLKEAMYTGECVISGYEDSAQDLNISKTENNFICGSSIVVDIDSNAYNTVEVGNQCWMKENLKVTKDSQGNNIMRYCYDNDESICETDGGLYDWNTVMAGSIKEGAQGICPAGWHLPKNSEWDVLENGLEEGDCSNKKSNEDSKILKWDDCVPAGRKLISGGSSGFENLLSGYRDANGVFLYRGKSASIWSSSSEETNVWSQFKSSATTISYRGPDLNGYSVRCLKN